MIALKPYATRRYYEDSTKRQLKDNLFVLIFILVLRHYELKAQHLNPSIY
jgi:hypothetical protein